MKRPLSLILLTLSLLLLPATVAMWARSCWRTDDVITHVRPGREIVVSSWDQRIVIHTYRSADVAPRPGTRGWMPGRYQPPQPVYYSSSPTWRRHRRFLDFQLDEYAPIGASPPRHATTITIPYYPIAWVLLIAPSLALLRARRRPRNRQDGHCRTCGYDLRASTDRCPECGTAIDDAFTSHDALPSPGRR